MKPMRKFYWDEGWFQASAAIHSLHVHSPAAAMEIRRNLLRGNTCRYVFTRTPAGLILHVYNPNGKLQGALQPTYEVLPKFAEHMDIGGVTPPAYQATVVLLYAVTANPALAAFHTEAVLREIIGPMEPNRSVYEFYGSDLVDWVATYEHMMTAKILQQQKETDANTGTKTGNQCNPPMPPPG